MGLLKIIGFNHGLPAMDHRPLLQASKPGPETWPLPLDDNRQGKALKQLQLQRAPGAAADGSEH